MTTTIEYRDIEVRSSELETDLPSSNESVDKDFEIVVSKPSSSLSSIPFHVLFKSCFLEKRHLKSIRKRFKFPRGVVTRWPHPNEKACTFAHGEVSFYEATFSCGLCFPIHPFIMKLLSTLNVAPGHFVPNAWRTIIGCMSIWVSAQDGDMITLNEFLHLYRYRYFELLPWSRESRIVHSFPTSFRDWKSWYFFVSRSGWETMTNDLWGEVPWLLRKWEIPFLSAFFYLSIRLIVLASLFLIFFFNFLCSLWSPRIGRPLSRTSSSCSRDCSYDRRFWWFGRSSSLIQLLPWTWTLCLF